MILQNNYTKETKMKTTDRIGEILEIFHLLFVRSLTLLLNVPVLNIVSSSPDIPIHNNFSDAKIMKIFLRVPIKSNSY